MQVLDSMLSRNAQGLYWMSRYLERAEYGCRLLADQLLSLEDRPIEEIERSWRRLYAGLGRTPIVGDLELGAGSDSFMLADAFTLADELSFEAANPDAIRCCVAAARENARQVRNAIGQEMWSCLNVAYLGLRDVRIEEVWTGQPREFYLRTEDALRTFSGIADSTMYRDHGWHFLELGRFVERAQLVAALVDAQVSLYPTNEAHAESDWGSLLGICQARAAFRRLHSLQYHPVLVVDFLVSDPRLSHSIRYALERIAAQLREVAARSGFAPALAAQRRVGRIAARLDYDWPYRSPDDDTVTRAVLGEIRSVCRLLHGDIEAAYFHYAVEDSPGS